MANLGGLTTYIRDTSTAKQQFLGYKRKLAEQKLRSMLAIEQDSPRVPSSAKAPDP